MTVKELKQQLEKYPDEMDVFMDYQRRRQLF